jgi:hypothetical protein
VLGTPLDELKQMVDALNFRLTEPASYGIGEVNHGDAETCTQPH